MNKVIDTSYTYSSNYWNTVYTYEFLYINAINKMTVAEHRYYTWLFTAVNVTQTFIVYRTYWYHPSITCKYISPVGQQQRAHVFWEFQAMLHHSMNLSGRIAWSALVNGGWNYSYLCISGFCCDGSHTVESDSTTHKYLHMQCTHALLLQVD